MTDTWDPPQELDEYVLVAPLGSGQMGKVYLAEDTILARHVAIKFIADLEPDAATRQRFLIEARAAARVQHPNVVTIHRVGEHEEKPYLITEFVRGQRLDQIDKPVPWTRALQIGIDLARGLAAAHRKGVLHRDIKAANVILDEEGTAKLLDFGLATLAEHNEDSNAEGIVGTPDFMAPELWRGEPASRRSDVYALGAVLYELTAGRLPFDDIPVADLAQVVQERDTRPLSQWATGVDPRFAAVVDRCMRREAEQRYGSGDELREVLEAVERSAQATPIPEGNPYRGLRTFEADHRALFFGRSVEIGVLIDRLRIESFLVVTGDSGVGKSSLCRAGVLPAIADGALGGGRSWRTVRAVPGKLPLSALVAGLEAELGIETGALARRIVDDPGTLGRELRQMLPPDAGLVIFMDQLEEMLTVSEASEAEAVERAIASLTNAGPSLRLLATVRADFLTRFASLPLLGEDLPRLLYFLRPLPRERIREVIVGPAEATGVRFESDVLIDTLVDATASAQGGGLPLLQFALAQLWEARDASGVITQAVLDAMGGVAGALAGHSDGIIGALPAAQRVAVKRLLTRLVTAAGTRARRTEAEIGGEDSTSRAALDALVRGRLLVAYDSDGGGTAYELAHEVLIRGWGTFRRWLAEDSDARIVRERLANAVKEWQRLGRVRDTLWSARQLRELDASGAGPLDGVQVEFVRQSRERVARLRVIRGALVASLPLIAASVYGAIRWRHQAETDRRVTSAVATTQHELAGATALATVNNEMRKVAFRLFDSRQRDAAESAWAVALATENDLDQRYARASQNLEGALAEDATRADVRALFAQVLYERALLAERGRRLGQRQELVGRLGVYDSDGDDSYARRLNAPAQLALASDPPGAEVSIERPPDWAEASVGVAPIAGYTLEPGLYTFVLRAPGRAAVRYPLYVERGESLDLTVTLPKSEEVPPGFIYIPAGRFLFGSGGQYEQLRRSFFSSVPIHPAETGAYYIGRTEVTYADWLAWLDTLPPAEQDQHRPAVPVRAGAAGALEVTHENGGWQIAIQPAGEAYKASAGEPIVYQHRVDARPQSWLRFPVMGVSAVDAEAYAAWLRTTGRVVGARLCREDEWERAARGADDRDYPHGFALHEDDANFDETYGHLGTGPDEVGMHLASRSLFGVDDMAGNGNEVTRSVLDAGAYIVRGGSYYHDQKTNTVFNRTIIFPELRDATLGVRLCADAGSR